MAFKKTLSALYLAFLSLCCPSSFHPNLAPSFNLSLSLYSNEFYRLLPWKTPFTSISLISWSLWVMKHMYLKLQSKQPERREDIWCLALWVWVTFLQNDYFQSHPFACECHIFFLNIWLTFHSVTVPHTHYQFTRWCMSWLFPLIAYCKESSNIHGWARVSTVESFECLPKSGLAG